MITTNWDNSTSQIIPCYTLKIKATRNNGNTGLTVINIATKLSRIKDKLKKNEKRRNKIYGTGRTEKKSWNALDEHLKDKELIKEDELERLIGHADKGIHAIARLNIRLILDFPADINLIFDGSDTAQQIKPDLHHYPSGMDSLSLLDIATTRFLQRTQIDEMPLVEVIAQKCPATFITGQSENG